MGGGDALGLERRADARDTTSVASAGVLSSGHGAHACLGALLAREQARAALEYLTEHAPGLRLDPGSEIRWYRNAGNRGARVAPRHRLGCPATDPRPRSGGRD